MTITAVQWADAAQTAYLVTTDGGTSTVPNDARLAACRDVEAWAATAGNTVAPAPVVAAPAPARVAALSTLLDPLSPGQRASITADHMTRLLAEMADHPDGLPISNNKVARAAPDLGMTPDAWFKLAGC